jgi:hypothetical protein
LHRTARIAGQCKHVADLSTQPLANTTADRSRLRRRGDRVRAPLIACMSLLLALCGPYAMSDLGPESALKRTSADHSEFMGSGSRS